MPEPIIRINSKNIILELNSKIVTQNDVYKAIRYFFDQKMKKLLLMGSEGAGKTSMHSVIFANYPTKNTHKIGYTTDRKEYQIHFMGNLTFSLWDCGGQDTFMENYFMVQRETIFKNVQVVIYVFDIEEPEEKLKKSLDYWAMAVKSMELYNPNGSIFVLVHKMDKIPDPQKKQASDNKIKQIKAAIDPDKVKFVKEFFSTSIWDESLYKAWSRIVQELIPNRQKIVTILEDICRSSLCSEAALFERSSFLTLGYYHQQGKGDMPKYQKIANIIKQFKLTCKKHANNIDQISMQNDRFNLLISQFTNSENILLVYKDKKAKVVAQINCKSMGKIFEAEKQKYSS